MTPQPLGQRNLQRIMIMTHVPSSWLRQYVATRRAKEMRSTKLTQHNTLNDGIRRRL
jgi:hypothetical protein